MSIMKTFKFLLNDFSVGLSFVEIVLVKNEIFFQENLDYVPASHSGQSPFLKNQHFKIQVDL